MGGCADKQRFSQNGLNHLNSGLTTQFSHKRLQTNSRQILLKPNNYLNAPATTKIDGSLTRVSSKQHLQGTEKHEEYSQESNSENFRVDKDDLLLKETQSYYVQEQNYQPQQLKVDRQCHRLQQSIILVKKYDNFLCLPQAGHLTMKNTQKQVKNKNKKQMSKNL